MNIGQWLLDPATCLRIATHYTADARGKRTAIYTDMYVPAQTEGASRENAEQLV
jgi:hypothetical protein